MGTGTMVPGSRAGCWKLVDCVQRPASQAANCPRLSNAPRTLNSELELELLADGCRPVSKLRPCLSRSHHGRLSAG